MQPIVGIMAATRDGVVGLRGKLPWNYPEELAHFRNTTLNHTIVMGQKTYECMPKSLFKRRQAIVLSRNSYFQLKDGVIFCNLDKFLGDVQTNLNNTKIFMIGGGEIANLFLANNLISSFILTHIHKPYRGDTYLNMRYFEGWVREKYPGEKYCKEEIEINNNYRIYLLKNPKLLK